MGPPPWGLVPKKAALVLYTILLLAHTCATTASVPCKDTADAQARSPTTTAFAARIVSAGHGKFKCASCRGAAEGRCRCARDRVARVDALPSAPRPARGIVRLDPIQTTPLS